MGQAGPQADLGHRPGQARPGRYEEGLGLYLAGLARPMKPVKPTGRPIGLELAGPGEPIAEGRRSQQFSRY